MIVEPLRVEDVALLCVELHGQLQIGVLCFFEVVLLCDACGCLCVAELRSHVEF